MAIVRQIHFSMSSFFSDQTRQKILLAAFIALFAPMVRFQGKKVELAFLRCYYWRNCSTGAEIHSKLLKKSGIRMSDIDIAGERKNQIVSATIDCIAKHGYYNFSMQDVAKTASVSKGIIHYYFLNKHDLMLSVLERVSKDMSESIATRLSSIDSPPEKLANFIEFSLDLVRSHREFFQVFLDFLPQVDTKKQARQLLAGFYENSRILCHQILEEGLKSQNFTLTNTLDYSYHIMSLIDGLSLRWLLTPDVVDFDKLSKQLTNIIIEGLCLTWQKS